MTITLIGEGSEAVLPELINAGVPYRIWLIDSDEDLGNVSIRIPRSVSPTMVAGIIIAWIRACTSRSLSIRIDGTERTLKVNELSVKRSSLLLAQAQDIKLTENPRASRKKLAANFKKLVDATPKKVLSAQAQRRAYRE